MIEAGVAVCLHGLTSAPQLNGSAATCKEFDAEKGRWNVELPGGEVKALKPTNLIPAAQAYTGADVLLENGHVVHVRLGNQSKVDLLSLDRQQELLAEMGILGEKNGVKAELRRQDGSKVFSAVLSGPVDAVRRARPELSSMLQFYGLFSGAAGSELQATAEEEEERRIDPEDGVACTLQQLREKYAGVYERDEIEEYWDASCTPVSPEEAAAAGAGGEPVDTVEVEGTEMKSLPARNRRKATDRYGRERNAGFSAAAAAPAASEVKRW